MKKASLFVALVFLGLSIEAQSQPAEVLLFGVFHFHNPGRDVVRVDQIDVTTTENQEYLQHLTKRLCDFKPTTILLEFEPSHEAEMLHRLKDYLDGMSELGTNEIYQIGFRVAKTCDVEKLHGIDESEIGWEAEPLFEYFQKFAPDLQAAFSDTITQLTESEAEAHRKIFCGR